MAIFHDPVKLEECEPGYPSPALRNALAADDLNVTDISLETLLAGGLSHHTCLCVPGGFAHNYAARLGARGFHIIRHFVARGGGYVGVCAGAYLGSSDGLALLPITCGDVHRWARGSGPCQLRFTQSGHRLLGAAPPVDPSSGDAAEPVTVRYANGPLLEIADGATGVTPLATFETEFRDALHSGHRFGSRLQGSPAVVVGRAGGGVVALASPHIEDGTDARSLTPFANLVRLCSRGSFYQRWIEGEWGGVGGEVS